MNSIKRMRKRGFKDKILSLDIGFGLAFMGLVIVNCILVRHINLSFSQSIIESFSLGFALPRLLK